jgi:methyl-accepting chemotaxis protein
MKIEIIETLLVCGVVSIQLYVFIKTYRQIQLFKGIIPLVDKFKVTKVLIPSSELERLSPKEILANLEIYKNAPTVAPSNSMYSSVYGDGFSSDLFDNNSTDNQIENNIERAEVNIIECDVMTNYVFDKILYSVNNYLIRNRGGATDFNLIKDIVERNTDVVEEDINLSVAIPLYLGLMATMMGIVIALFNMPDLGLEFGNKEIGRKLDEGIAMLIGGVKIAMMASFIGLMLTITNSGWVFKGSRSFIEARKNDFYTFIQIELLPIINQGLASTLESLQRNLFKFNSEFSTNLSGLTGIFDANTRAIKAQKELLDTIDKAKVSEMTRYNVKVLQQLDVSVIQFEKFNRYLTNLTSLVENSQLIVNRTNELLSRTDNFKTIADNLEKRLDQSQQLLEFLSAHFNKLEEHREFTSNAVADIGHSISETFKELKEHIQNSSDYVKQFTVEEIEALKEALSSSKTNLGNLEHLATLKTDVSQFKNSSAAQGERLKQSIDDLNRNMAISIALLEQIERNSISRKAKGITASLKNLFKPKN